MAKRKRKRIASRGSVNNIILRTLVNGDKYGYEIIKEVEDFSQGKISLKQPSLYSSLSRFEDKGFVTSYWGDSDIGGRRHYYHLTEKGMEHYKIHILKETDDEDENETIEEYETLIEDDIHTESIDVEIEQEDFMEENAHSNENICEAAQVDNDIVMNEIDEDELPSIVQFEVKESEEIIPDHNFYIKTPIESIANTSGESDNNISKELSPNNETKVAEDEKLREPDKILDIENSSYDKLYTNNDITDEEPKDNKDIEYPWLELSSIAKKSRDKLSTTPNNKLYLKQRPKAKKVILDTDGIYKLRDEDYVPVPRTIQKKTVIIDNVGKRSSNNNNYSYTTYSDTTKSSNISNNIELTEEEKRRKNENFVAKFNMLTMSRMKPVSAPVQTKKDPLPPKDIDYRGKLDNILENNRIIEEQSRINEERIKYEESYTNNNYDNNIFNYTDSEIEETEEDRFIDFEPIEEFETKTDSSEYVSKITSYSVSNDDIKINRYETKSNAVLMDKTYVLINRLKFAFGLLLSIIIGIELLVSYLILKNNNMLVGSDNIVFIVALCIIGIILISSTIPLIVSHNEHKCNNFKLKYAFWFGLLTFLVLSIITYCVNALIGFEIEYFNVFATKLIVPIVLAFNFVLGPIIYYLLSKIPKFYD